MRSAQFRSLFDVAIVDRLTPTPAENEVLVRVGVNAVCASDARYIEDGNPNPGHEAVGIVEALGEGVTNVSVGDRVVVLACIGCGRCRYCLTGYTVHCPDEFLSLWDGYSEFVCVRSDACLALPDSISLLDGSIIADTLGPAFTGVKAGEVKGKVVAVWGCGPVGQMAVQLCKTYGAKQIVALDPIEFRRQKAEEFGADIVMDPSTGSPVEKLHKLNSPLGVDVGICATFAGNVPDQALVSTRLEGRFISVMGVAKLNEDELRHRFSYGVHYFRRDHYDEMVKLVAEGRVDLKPVTTHTYPLEDIAEAFRMRFSKQEQSLKVGVLTGAISESDTVSV